MRRTIPLVKGGRLYHQEREGDPINVGTPGWFDWLERHNSFTFVDRLGSFAVHKSGNNPNDLDWKASRTNMGKLFRVSLGPSHALTLSRLQDAARKLAGKHASARSAPLSPVRPAAATLSAPKTGATAGPSSSLVHTKLTRPRSGSDVITRTRLIERLNIGLGGSVTLISAPAGYGKTTLLVEWLQASDRPSAWLSLDANDNELLIFVHSLTAALQTIFPDAFQSTASLFKAPLFPPANHVATLLINDLADLPEDIILVLDDYHLIHSSEVHTLLDLLIRHLSPQLHLVLATRSDPPLPLARWRAQGRLNELRGADLRCTLEETETFLTRVLGSVAARETAIALEERTEGWIAALRLAALSLSSAADHAAFIERLRHYPDRSMNSYLVDEILAQQAPDVQELLERTSILKQFCAELCAAVLVNETPGEQVQATLDWLERSNVFLVSLDKRQGWYRFHHLFKRLFEQRLQARLSQEEIAMLHRRASTWYAVQGLIQEAIEHARAAGDAPNAARLVEAQFLPAFEQEQLVQMERWLNLLPEEQIQVSPVLLFARVWILQAHGQLKDLPRLLATAEQLLNTSDSAADDLDDPRSRIFRALIAVGWSQFHYFTGQAQASLESARSALEWFPPGEEHVASFALMFLAWSYQATGQEDVALVTLQQALRDQSTLLASAARLLFAQALVYLAAGKLPQVEHTARHLLRLAQEADLALSQNFAHWLLGVVHYEQNDLDTAVFHFSAVIANWHHAHFWAVRDAMCGLALAFQAQGLGAQARETARTLLEMVQEQHNMRELMLVYAFCGRLALLQDQVEEASQWLELAGSQEVLLGPLMFFEDPPLTEARLLLARGDEVSMAHGQALLTQFMQYVEAIHSTRKTIKVLALQALAYDRPGSEAEALDVLERALALARSGGFVRTFADLPELSKLLGALRKRRKARKVLDKKLDAYIQRILAAMSPLAAQAVSTEELMRQEGIEPLTERELQILRLLEKDLTNKEIARELVVTPGTVKVHTNNVYRKLSVNNRRAAVTLVKALGLLVADQTSTPPGALTS